MRLRSKVSMAAVLILLLSSVSILSGPMAAAAAEGLVIGQPNCNTSCGGVSVPYPFGMGPPHCYMPGFKLTCDTSHNPARLLLGDGDDGTLRVDGIYLRPYGLFGSSSVRVMRSGGAIRIDAAHGNGTLLGARGPYTLSSRLNELVLTGCNVQATLQERGSGVATTMCSSVCPDLMSYDDLRADLSSRKTEPGGYKYCTAGNGAGCCQELILSLTAKPNKINGGRHDPVLYDVQLKWFGEDLAADEKRLPTYVFVAEEGWFDQRKVHNEVLLRSTAPRRYKEEVPVLLHWEVGAENVIGADSRTADCSTEESSSICKSNHSSCAKSRGYTCSCLTGYEGNPYLANGCQDVDECQSKYLSCFGECRNTIGSYECWCPRGTHGDPSVDNGCLKSVNTGLNVGVGVGIGAGVILLLLVAIFMAQKFKLQRARKLRQHFFKQNRGQLLQQLVSQRADIAERMIITMEELEKATNNFDKARELGGGGHGTVYKGILSDLHVVAIKKPKKVVQKEIDEFINEVAILSQVNHRNVVKLHGCCLETEVPMLVYEFISNGTLHDHLHIDGPKSLSWVDRLRIATETAKSIAYLHSTAIVPIIHRDIKSVNILLDDTLTAKVADFGASRYVPLDKSGVTTMVQGTIGYMDPVYFQTGRLTEKSDVYSFGVVLVELLTRKKPYLYMSSEANGLAAHFATLFAEGNMSHILDQQVMEEGGKEVEQVAALAVACVKLSGEDRPTMRQVEWTLEGLQASNGHVLNNGVIRQSENSGIAIRCPRSKDENGCEESSRQYSMEEEYMLSARYPR